MQCDFYLVLVLLTNVIFWSKNVIAREFFWIFEQRRSDASFMILIDESYD